MTASTPSPGTKPPKPAALRTVADVVVAKRTGDDHPLTVSDLVSSYNETHGRPQVIEIHRCDGCGRISTARRKPRRHQRWAAEGDPLFDPEKDEGGLGAPSGHSVDCGPFHTYRAVPIEEKKP